jgi:hypothetical protein
MRRVFEHFFRVVLVGSLLLSLPCGRAAAHEPKELPPVGLKYYPSPYYDVYSDLEEERVREAILRMTRMAEEYHERTKEFTGAIRSKFRFYLFKNPEDYYRNGGPTKSFGAYITARDTLMSQGGDPSRDGLWRTIQHEGFHQFVHNVIGRGLPSWLDEGMAVYFEHSIFTGDGFVSGVLPAERGARVQEAIREKRLKSVRAMMAMTQVQWNAEADPTNYDMVWSMVYFLVHGEGGKYSAAFVNFLKDVGRNARPWEQSWVAFLGPADAFEKRWSDWWVAQDLGATGHDPEVRATVAALTSVLGRAAMAGQNFEGVEKFLVAAKDGSLKSPPAEWLPPSVLSEAIDRLDRLQASGEVTFALALHPAKLAGVTATKPDGTRITAAFNPKVREAIQRAVVVVDDLAPRLEQAKSLLEEKKKDQAKLLLKDALKRNPQSPLAPEAQKLLRQLG